MAHTGYNKTLKSEISEQSGISNTSLEAIKSDSYANFQTRMIGNMESVISDLNSRTGGPAKVALIESDQDSNDTADGQNGLDNLPSEIKNLVKSKKFSGAIRHPHVNKGFYWATGSKLYRFQNRNEFDTYQKALAAKMTQELVTDLDSSSNTSIKKNIKATNTQIEALNSKSRAAGTNYETQVAAIIAGVSA